MKLVFQDPDLERLAFDTAFTGGRSQTLVKAYRNRINRLMQSVNRLDLYNLRSNQLEKLKGKRKNQHSIRINKQFRLVLEFVKQEHGETIKVVAIEDYH